MAVPLNRWLQPSISFFAFAPRRAGLRHLSAGTLVSHFDTIPASFTIVSAWTQAKMAVRTNRYRAIPSYFIIDKSVDHSPWTTGWNLRPTAIKSSVKSCVRSFRWGQPARERERERDPRCFIVFIYNWDSFCAWKREREGKRGAPTTRSRAITQLDAERTTMVRRDSPVTITSPITEPRKYTNSTILELQDASRCNAWCQI